MAELPKIVFLCSEEPERELCNHITDLIPAAVGIEFREPIDGAIAGAFYEGDPTFSFSEREKHLIQGLDVTVHLLADLLERWFESLGGPEILGKLAGVRILEAADWFESFIIDDAMARHKPSVKFLIKKFGPANCLIVNVGGEKPLFGKNAKTINIQRTNPTQMFAAIREKLRLEETPHHDDTIT